MAWSTKAKSRAKSLETEFKLNLRRISECVSNHEQAITVSDLHVNKAFDCLANAGLSRRRWIDRPDAETAFGGTLIGLAFATPGVTHALFGSAARGIAGGTVVGFFIAGVALFLHGTYRAKVPSEPISTVLTWRRALFSAILVILIAAMLAMGYLLLSGPPSDVAQ